MVHPTRREFAAGLSAAALAFSTGRSALAQSGSPARIVVGYPPGGTLDVTARRVSEAWREQGRASLVDNRSGAAGRVANAQLKREKADGSVMLCTHTSALSIYPHVYAKLGYDPVADFRPVSPLASVTCAFAVSTAAVPASVTTLDAYVKWIKATPQAANFASPAAGSMAHFLGYQLDQAAGLKLTHVPYRGSAPAMQDLLGGQITAYMGFVADFLQYPDNQKLRILAVTSEKRSRFLPGVPTFAELGLAQVTGVESYGLFLPPRASDAMVAELAEATRQATQSAALIAGFDKLGLEPLWSSPAAYAQQIARESRHWRPIVAASGFRSEE
ncbi:MAG: tripartite tricarboxylate transporter substrate-binding protein [Comamonas sp.]